MFIRLSSPTTADGLFGCCCGVADERRRRGRRRGSGRQQPASSGMGLFLGNNIAADMLMMPMSWPVDDARGRALGIGLLYMEWKALKPRSVRGCRTVCLFVWSADQL